MNRGGGAQLAYVSFTVGILEVGVALGLSVACSTTAAAHSVLSARIGYVVDNSARFKQAPAPVIGWPYYKWRPQENTFIPEDTWMWTARGYPKQAQNRPRTSPPGAKYGDFALILH